MFRVTVCGRCGRRERYVMRGEGGGAWCLACQRHGYGFETPERAPEPVPDFEEPVSDPAFELE